MIAVLTYKPYIRLRKIIVVMLAAIAIALPQSSFAQTGVPESHVKAVFLFNFTQFTEWPEGSFADGNAPLVIGILGNDPFDRYLEETVKDERVQGRHIVIQHYKSIDEVKSCHLLYISEKDPDKVSEIIGALKKPRMLTVSDCRNFTKIGGMIGFIKRNNKIKLQANPTAARSAGLTISSKLLRVSEITD